MRPFALAYPTFVGVVVPDCNWFDGKPASSGGAGRRAKWSNRAGYGDGTWLPTLMNQANDFPACPEEKTPDRRQDGRGIVGTGRRDWIVKDGAMIRALPYLALKTITWS